MNSLSKMIQSRGQTVKIGQALSQTIRDRGWQRKITEMKAVNSWNSKNVGKNVFANSQAYHIESGKLYVIVSNPTWMNELTFLKTQIIKNINQAVGSEVVKEIQFKIGDIKEYRKPHLLRHSKNNSRRTENSKSQKKDWEDVELKQEIIDKIDEAVLEIDDLKLRESFRRAIIVSRKIREIDGEPKVREK